MLSTGQMNLLKKENDAHENFFQAFHKKIFDEMLKEAIKVAVEIVVHEDDYPTSEYSVFEDRSYWELFEIILVMNIFFGGGKIFF